MRKFIFKTLWFLLPIIALNIFTFMFYIRTEGPDLLRMGYILNIFPNYHDIFLKEYENKIYYTQISEKPKDRKFKVLTLGDSFSEQQGHGYKNYLAKNNKITLLHIDRFLSDNQIQTLFSLLNADFFEQYHFEYVILENIERQYVESIENIDTLKKLSSKELFDLIDEKKNPKVKTISKPVDLSFKFPSKSTLLFPYYTFQYYSKNSFLFDDKVYKTKLSRSFFSVDNTDLLFYSYDANVTQKNNLYENVSKLNATLNNLDKLLKKKGVKLIVLPAPDKYDIYYDYIVDKKGFTKPRLLEQLQKMHKDYIYIDSKKILSNAITQKKDIYYYDDTHWSPWASQFIATEIEKQIKIDENKPLSGNIGIAQ